MLTLPASTRATYHHGNLRAALVEAALDIAREQGTEHVSVREAARRLGVSPAAPFRHFPTRRALMTAVAEEAATRLSIEVAKAGGRRATDGLARLRAIGRGYLRWASAHAAHFRIVSARDQIDLDGSPSIGPRIGEVRSLTEQALREAQGAGLVSSAHDPAALALLCRATAYGLARMRLDAHFAQWDVPEAHVDRAMASTLDLLVDLIAKA